MTYNEKLIKFMQLKNDIFFKNYNTEYFSKEDEDEIIKWDEQECENIFNKIFFNINKNEGRVRGLNSSVCPFCLKYDDCEDCTYSHILIKKICNKNYSDFQNIGTVFTNEVYKNIINEINDL